MEAAAASAGVQDSRCLYTHPPPWRRSSNACTAGKGKAFQSHRTGGVAILVLGRRPRTRKALSELISPISPAYPAASRTPCFSGTLRQPQQCYYQEHLNREYAVLSDSLDRARPIRPSAKRQTWLPPGPWSTPRVVSTDYQTSSPTKQVLLVGFCCSVLLFGFVVRFCCSVLSFGFVEQQPTHHPEYI